MAKRTKKTVIANVTSDQFDESLGIYATADAREKAINSKLDEQITKLREKVADELNDCKERKDQHFEVVQKYCEENESTLFSKKKSLETVHGLIGFRTGTPKLKTAKGYTWASVLNLLKALKPGYVRTKEEPNKEALLTDRDKLKGEMDTLGIEVVQEETFFIELKKEEVTA